MKLSALVVIHNEEERLAACLDKLAFADEIVVVLDKCTDGSKAIAQRYTSHLVEGSWELEGPRRNTGIEACSGDWIVEVDADEHVTPALAAELRQVIEQSAFAYHDIPVDNWIGARLVRRGWGASFGKPAYPGLFRKEAKRWGMERVHPRLTLAGKKGPALQNRIQHYVDRDISDMITRFDRYSTARAKDLLESGDIGSGPHNVRRIISRFWRCYVSRGGWREGGLGFLIALFAALYPLVSHLKAKYDADSLRSNR
ncbi:putative glycosyl transferase [mine drainage metagenome]|uniref:Putative glycosyl transferase n=1 Tax=mine drainage metagenome TaxID=410659 RepID=A0A1J5SKW8_9ZZZZ